MTHADFAANFDAHNYHNNVYTWTDFVNDARTSTMVVKCYVPDPRCPDLVVWAHAEGGLRFPGFKKGWTRESVMAHLGMTPA